MDKLDTDDIFSMCIEIRDKNKKFPNFTEWLLNNYNSFSECEDCWRKFVICLYSECDGAETYAVDWKRVPVDTLIEVCELGGTWQKQYFAEYHNYLIFCFNDGATSETVGNSKRNICGWRYGRLARKEDIENIILKERIIINEN